MVHMSVFIHELALQPWSSGTDCGQQRERSESSLAATTPPMMPNTTNCFMVGPAPSQGLAFQERLFQHANTPAVMRKTFQRKDYTQEIQRVELDSIILTCPETSDTGALLLGGSVQRRVQSRRRQACSSACDGAQVSTERVQQSLLRSGRGFPSSTAGAAQSRSRRSTVPLVFISALIWHTWFD